MTIEERALKLYLLQLSKGKGVILPSQGLCINVQYKFEWDCEGSSPSSWIGIFAEEWEYYSGDSTFPVDGLSEYFYGGLKKFDNPKRRALCIYLGTRNLQALSKFIKLTWKQKLKVILFNTI